MDDLRFGLEITAVGMGLVFGLLALFWAALTAAGRLEQALARRAERRREAAAGAPVRAGPVAVHGGADLPPEAVAAIAIAVLAHARARGRRAGGEAQAQLVPPARWTSSGRAAQVRTWTRGR